MNVNWTWSGGCILRRIESRQSWSSARRSSLRQSPSCQLRYSHDGFTSLGQKARRSNSVMSLTSLFVGELVSPVRIQGSTVTGDQRSETFNFKRSTWTWYTTVKVSLNRSIGRLSPIKCLKDRNVECYLSTG